MEVGLEPNPAAFITGQSHAQRVCSQNDVAKAGRMRPDINTRILQITGGVLGLRSLAGIMASKPECLPQATAAVNTAFAGVPPNQILRGFTDYRQIRGASLDALRTGSVMVNGTAAPTRSFP